MVTYTCSVWCVLLERFFYSLESAFPCSLCCGRPDIVNAGSGETRYSECRVRGDQI
ncbi:unnamed protein product [Staurois parvus]|uniref:Uncharacterized protein n=1 Tax=Staurois parvus TaxID=386267 RepID=A0ABN9GSP7_9NEOB|nr:unnamed protein product [Staurois parvus]